MEREVSFIIDVNGRKLPSMSMTELFKQTVAITGLAVQTVGEMFSMAAKLPYTPLIVANPINGQVINVVSFHWVQDGRNYIPVR